MANPEYDRGFRDGAAAATEAQGTKFEDAIAELEDGGGNRAGFYSRGQVMDLLRLLARQSQSLAARIAAVDPINPRDRSDDGNEDEGESGDPR